MRFCNPFDEALARHGPPAVFLFDRQGLLRFDAHWTRDAYGRAPDALPRGEAWVLLRDHATGFVTLAYATSPELLAAWPRADVRRFHDHDAAAAARAQFGHPPVCTEPWR